MARFDVALFAYELVNERGGKMILRTIQAVANEETRFQMSFLDGRVIYGSARDATKLLENGVFPEISSLEEAAMRGMSFRLLTGMEQEDMDSLEKAFRDSGWPENVPTPLTDAWINACRELANAKAVESRGGGTRALNVPEGTKCVYCDGEVEGRFGVLVQQDGLAEAPQFACSRSCADRAESQVMTSAEQSPVSELLSSIFKKGGQ